MKKLVNTFHGSETTSKLNGNTTLSDLMFEAQALGKSSKAYKTLTRIEKLLCPHFKKGCNCSAFIIQLDT